MLSNQRLVGRHNMFALLDRALYQIVSRTGASNQLYQHIDFRIFSQRHHITADAGVAVVMVGVLPARANMNQFHRLARTSLQYLGLPHQDVHRGKADGTYAADSDIQAIQTQADSSSAETGGPWRRTFLMPRIA